MQSLFDNRRTNLRMLIDQWGGPLPISRKLGYRNASFIVQMAGPNPTREISERTARKIEEALGLAPGWLDAHPAGNNGDRVAVDMTLVSRAITAVAATADDFGIRLTPVKLGDIVALVYTDAEAHAGTIRHEFIKSIFNLIK